MNVQELRKKYPIFAYNNFSIEEDENRIYIKYEFEIVGLTKFTPTMKIEKKEFNWKNINTNQVKAMVFYLGMIEAISYFKATCSPQFVINCGKIDEEQAKWFLKLYYLGLGEFRYRNQIVIEQNEFVKFISNGENIDFTEEKDALKGIIIPIGGGKDSNVTLDLLKEYKEESLCFCIGGKKVSLECAKKAGFERNKVIEVYRKIDKNLIFLNEKGFLNGHTPFSAIVAFTTYIISFLLGKKYVALSNEDSANQSNVVGEKINHQYSKTIEFENDFRNFASKYLRGNVEYFSMLRPINELQIAMLFSKLKSFHSTFKSCNVGSKTEPWKWCCNCPKCLFVYTILSPFLKREELIQIFGEDLFEREDLKETFIELCGFGKIKPFECVGTYEEVQYSVSKTIENLKSNELPYLLKLYKENYPMRNEDLLHAYNENHNVPAQFEKILKKEIFE